MSATKQAAALTAANTIIQACQSLTTLRTSINQLVTQYNSEDFSTVWSNLATAALNDDGSLGAVDSAPNTTHPIDTRVAANTALNKAVSQAQFVNAVAMLEQLQNFFGNQPVAQNNYTAIIDALAT
jgi:hypothetical protein